MAKRKRAASAPAKGFDVKAFGLACGVLTGAVMLIMTLIASFTGYGGAFLALMESIYPYYVISIPGAFIGLIYGFIDGFIGGAIFAWLYNKFL